MTAFRRPAEMPVLVQSDEIIELANEHSEPLTHGLGGGAFFQPSVPVSLIITSDSGGRRPAGPGAAAGRSDGPISSPPAPG
jgi:hypothetical protein